ncbi:MAG: ATP-binding protein [Bacteroidales bacterium]|nr:ATP-binding protein [Bacteroidales bacterium]
MNKRKEIIIESSSEEMFRVEQFVEEISDEYLLYGNYYGNILMAVSEAVKNAIIHGNKQDRQKLIRIVQESTKEGLWIKVTDEGEGFDYGNYSLKESHGENFSEKNNGLLLIYKLTDEVRFGKNGSQIEMLFRINGIDDSVFERRVAFMQEFLRVYQRLNK